MTSFDLERLPAFQHRKMQIGDQLRHLSAFADTFDAVRAAAIRQAAVDLETLIFNVAVIGEFNRGKTTLVNALLGRPGLLSAAPLPNTSAITRIMASASGASEYYRIVFRNPQHSPTISADLGSLNQFTSDSSVDKGSNAESVERIELFLDSDFLRRSGIVLIDTPGLGAISRAHQDITERIIPTVHAALFVFMVDPPPGAVEIAFLRFSHVYISRFLFVMNDKHNLSQQSPADASAVIAYAQSELAAAGIESPQVISLNPGAYLRGAEGGFAAFWPILAEFLIAGRGRALLNDAIRKAEQHRVALDSALARQIADTERQTSELQAILGQMNKQIVALETRRLALLGRVESELREIVVQLVAEIDKLGERIDHVANDAVDKAGFGMLPMMHIHLPAAIQQTVIGWLDDRSAWINSRCAALYGRVINDLRELVKDYQAADLSAVAIKPFELPRGIDIALGGDVALSLATGLGIAAGIALLDVLSTGGIGVVSLVAGGAAGGGTASAMLMQRVKTNLKTALHEPLPTPNESRTTLSALIEGYINEYSQPIAGLRARMVVEFDALGETVKVQINAAINEAWQPRLNELQGELNRRTASATNIDVQRSALETARRQLGTLGESFRAIAETLDEL